MAENKFKLIKSRLSAIHNSPAMSEADGRSQYLPGSFSVFLAESRNSGSDNLADINLACDLQLMRPYFSYAFLFFLAACDGPDDVPIIPANSDVDRIEQLLAKQRCVGDLSRWERRYQFLQDVSVRSASRGRVDPRIIAFRLRRGGATYPIEPVRVRLPVSEGFIGEIDDRPGYWSDGQFDTASGKLAFDGCGYSEGG